MDTSKGQIRKWANQLARDEQPGEERNPELVALDEEKRLYEELTSRPGSGHGWTVASKQPLHRLAKLDSELTEIIRSEIAKQPLLSKIERYKEMDWWLSRSAIHLTDEELDSRPVYRELYEALVAKGKAPHRDIVETAPDQEPSGGERYQIAKALRDGVGKIPLMDPLRRTAGILYTALKDGKSASEAIEHTFRHDPGTEAQTLTALEIYVPEVARLVLWLNARKAA